MKSFRIVIPPWYPRSRISRRMTWALVTPSTTTRWVMYSLKGSSLLGCLPRRYRRVGPSFRLRATVLRSIPRRLAISVFDRPFSKSSRTFITSSPRSTESPPLGREFGDSGSLRVRIFHSAISRSFASAVLTHFIPATTERPDQLWVADMTQQHTDEGWLYLAVVVDAFSRRVIGWSMGERPVADL